MMDHEKYMRRCLQLAENGLGLTYPNPMVGSVIVCKDKIIGEGWHQKAGQAHAEVNAINSVADKSLLRESTIYVSLEPCSHYGKTPPCADLIISSGIPNVMIGITDVNEKVAGKGIQKLQSAGINVINGILENECYAVNRRFFTFHKKRRPYIILKWAESADGFIAPPPNEERKPVYITNPVSRQLVHKWRTEEHAILIGTNTAIIDNPQLTARSWKGNNPIRIVIDRTLKIQNDSHLFDNQVMTIVICEQRCVEDQENIIFETAEFGERLPASIMEILQRHEIQSVLIEGGTKTLQSFIDNDLWDEARTFTGIPILNNGTKAPVIRRRNADVHNIAGDELLIFRNHD